MERYNIVVIGAGSGGLVVAAGATGLGARVALRPAHLRHPLHLDRVDPGHAADRGPARLDGLHVVRRPAEDADGGVARLVEAFAEPGNWSWAMRLISIAMVADR